VIAIRHLAKSAVVAATGVAVLAAWADIAVRNGEDVKRGAELYAEHCASCHGKNLEGQVDWMKRLPSGRLPAPPHDASGHTWHHSDEQLFTITKDGMAAIVPDYESDMPAFRDVLTDAEIRDVLAFIKSTWPERERAYQAGRSGTSSR
jgi:mono/diheme cytochrome c family protein